MAAYVPFLLRYKVLPAYSQVFMGMNPGGMMPAFSRLVLNLMDSLALVLLFLVVLLWLVTIAYVGGPRLRQWLRRIWPGGVDRFMMLLPWRRKRMKRDFTGILALLLDASVPEAEAVRLAANAVENRVLRARAQRVSEALARGESLPRAIERIDSAGQVRWRLSNALHSGKNFMRALAGWHHTLDAEAEQQEQAAAQIATTGLVLLNGVIVGSVIIAVFLLLIQIIQYD
jgi:type II secretory pathway component PulF